MENVSEINCISQNTLVLCTLAINGHFRGYIRVNNQHTLLQHVSTSLTVP